MLQLKDCAINISRKSNKQAISKMFPTEICRRLPYALVSMHWFEKEIKKQHLEPDQA